MIAFIFAGAFNLMPQFKATSPDLAHAAVFYGIYSAVARRLKVTPQHVRSVALGKSTSKRVSRAIESEIQRRKRAIQERAA
jgi:hypothetical protein